jgi:hypothetical protein
MSRTFFGLVLLIVVACQPVPHPFADAKQDPDSPILTLPDSLGIVVGPVDTLAPDASLRLSEAMAAALREAGVPADTEAGNRRSFHLTGSPVTQGINWELRSAEGEVLGHQIAPTGQVAEIAPKIAALIQDPPPVEHKPHRILLVRPVEGAPGDGNTALPRALTFLLQRRGVSLAKAPEPGKTIEIAGSVAIRDAASPGLQHVSIRWRVLAPDGKEVGIIHQENDVPRGALDGVWGDVGMAVASAALDEMIRVVGAIPEND